MENRGTKRASCTRAAGKTLADYGEDRVLAALLAQLPPLEDATVAAGAGDDCAIVRPAKAGYWQLLKTDCVIEGVHFTPGTPPRKIGWKALCRPLSDIAAMGGEPRHALITLAVAESVALRWVEGIYSGIARAARAYGVTVVGGETARSPGPCFISVCLTGDVPAKKVIGRGGGVVGDLLYVTGRLGSSFTSGRHLRFRPRLAEARWLVEHCRVHAMMDLSDGLATDLPRLAAASGTGFELDRARVPRSPGCTVEQALGDGEDYELLLAIDPRDGPKVERAWKQRFPALRLSNVGRLAKPGIKEGLGSVSGYQHFQNTRDEG